MRRFFLLGTSLVLTWGVGCSKEDERPPPPMLGASGAPNTPEPVECEPPPEVDTTDACGEETVQLFRRQPTLYFILDVSGSMGEPVLEGSGSKLNAAKTALNEVATAVGHLSRYGLAIFPGTPNEDDQNVPRSCAPGGEVFEVQAGDPIECVNLPPGGPVLSSFKRVVADLEAFGGTPLSSTIENLTPILAGQEGTTAAILITDGAPNCNGDTSCDADECELNRQSAMVVDENQNLVACDESLNCCDPDSVGAFIESPQLQCRDIDASEAAIAALTNSGIPTYVVGVLGDLDFDDAMNRLAMAGGRPREGQRAYYDVSSLDELSATVRAIGLDVAQTCEIELLERPLFANELNVYFDADLVPSDPVDGWTLMDDTVTLHGPTCDRVKSGEVEQIQLISGCQTIVK